MGASQKNTKTAFTLVEIMIVVAIIGLLSVLALPAFAKARKTSIREKCINNMRAIYGGAMRYEIDYGTTLFTVRADGVAIRNRLLTNGYVNAIGNFDCPSSPIKDFDDYQLVYSNRDLISVTCTYVSTEHLLP